jgi:alpha-D-xyloside xylohydrolase
MQRPIDWTSLVSPRDVFSVPIPRSILRCWESVTPTPSGLACRGEAADGRPVDLQLEVVQPEVVRVRMSPRAITERRSEMLVGPAGPTPAFEVSVSGEAGLATLTTDRLRLELRRQPWQLRAFDRRGRSGSARPFFSQRVDDRAFGPAYEVPPTGFDDAMDPPSVWESVSVSPGEAFYGLGERFTALDRWGQEINLWSEDAGNVVSHRAYKSVPLLMSTAGYGLFVHASAPICFRMGTESSATYSFHVSESELDYFLIHGPSFKQILARYCQLTGFAPVPPRWSFGFWLSRCGYRSRAEVEQVVDEMRRRGFPCDVISLDPWWMGEGPWCTLRWDEDAFPEPAEMIRALREQGVRTCLWITPYVPEGSALHDEGAAGNYLVRRPDGSIARPVEAFAGGRLAAVDFTNPEARAWYQARLEPLIDQGVAVFKTDFGEQAPHDALYHDGRSGIEMHNLYPLLYNQAVWELVQRKRGRGITWGRSAYAGSQRYPVQWGGDSYASFDQLAGQLRGMLSYGMSGVPFSSHDVGGFDYPPGAFDRAAGLAPGDHIFRTEKLAAYPRDPALYVRWLQMGVFSSHIRAHGKGPREPWTYGEEAEAISRRFLALRYRLLPYIYSEAVRASRSGVPLARPMVLEFQEDPTTRHVDRQYMFGDSFLVAPVLTSDQRCEVYLPAGRWVDFWTGEVLTGPRWLEQDVPLDRLPLWVRAGAVVPLGPAADHTEQARLDPLTLLVALPSGATEATIHDEDSPDISVRCVRRGQELELEVEGAAGEVELFLLEAGGYHDVESGEPGVRFRGRAAVALRSAGAPG